MRSHVSALLLLCSSAACYVGTDGGGGSVMLDEDDAVFFVQPADEGSERDGGAVAPARAMALPASGWLDHEGSPITPWCGAVLVAPDVVVTAARCVDGWSHSYINVGFGRVGGVLYEVEEIVVQRDAPDRNLALAALRLAQPVVGIDPVDLDLRREEVCDVHSIGHEYVLRGDDSPRWVWTGCLDDGALVATKSAPNCHGDMGTGAFRSEGTLVGVAVDAWSDGGCAPGHRLASVADNEAFFDSALDLSSPAD